MRRACDLHDTSTVLMVSNSITTQRNDSIHACLMHDCSEAFSCMHDEMKYAGLVGDFCIGPERKVLSGPQQAPTVMLTGQSR